MLPVILSVFLSTEAIKSSDVIVLCSFITAIFSVETEMYCSVQTYNIYSTIKVEGCHNRMVVISPLPEGGGGYTVLPLSVRPRYFSVHFSQ